jgi:hypothetical protein
MAELFLEGNVEKEAISYQLRRQFEAKCSKYGEQLLILQKQTTTQRKDLPTFMRSTIIVEDDGSLSCIPREPRERENYAV